MKPQAVKAKTDRAEEDRIRAVYARRDSHDRYSLFNPGHLFTIQQLERQLVSLLRVHGIVSLTRKRILEIGCGTGSWLRKFVQWGARPENICGIDLLDDRIGEAKELCPQRIKLDCGSATELPFADASFDLVFQATVFTSILDSSMKKEVAAEMLRVVKDDGLILWYDYHIDNPWNPDVRGVKKREIKNLFSGCRIDLQPITLAPPIVRFLAPYSWLVCYVLGNIPLLCTHYLGAIQKIDSQKSD